MRHLTQHARLTGMLFILALSSACATPFQTLGIRENPPDIPPQVELSSTPFYPQLKHYCGPAVLAAFAIYRGIDVVPDAIAPLIHVPNM